MEAQTTESRQIADLIAGFQARSAPRLEGLGWVVRRYRATGSIGARAWRELRRARAFLRYDAEEHFRRVEAEIFPPLLRALGEGGPVSLILYDHRVLRYTFRRYAKAIERAWPGLCLECEEAARLIRVTEEVRDELAAHLRKEARLLLPLADGVPAPVIS